jgi:hypothetical protein
VRRSRFARSQRATIVTGILGLIGVIVVLQLWLFTATMEAYLGGGDEVAIPAAIASLLCFALAFGLRRYLRALDD